MMMSDLTLLKQRQAKLTFLEDKDQMTEKRWEEWIGICFNSTNTGEIPLILVKDPKIALELQRRVDKIVSELLDREKN